MKVTGNLDMDSEIPAKHDIVSYLLGLRDEKLLYCPNPGNAGDAIIAHATCQLFDRIGIDYELVPIDIPQSKTSGKVVVYGGGGNLVEPYPNAKQFIARHHSVAKTLIVLPHTILSYQDLLSELGENVVLFCRERESYGFVEQYHGKASFFLSDDMALSMDVNQTIADGNRRFLPVISSLGMLIRNSKRLVRSMCYSLKNRGTPRTLFAFREDVEKTNFKIPQANIDLSQAFSGDGMSEYETHEITYRVLKFIQQFDTVHTNRLHIGISSLLMGKQVYFYDNSYGKNRFVYENSLKGCFPNLIWRGKELEVGIKAIELE